MVPVDSVRNGAAGKCGRGVKCAKWSWRDLCEVELKGSARSCAGGNCGVRVKCEDGSWREVRGAGRNCGVRVKWEDGS